MKAWKNQFSGTFKVFHSWGKVSIPPHSYSEQAWEALWRLGSMVGLGCFEQVLAETCRKEKEWSMCMWAIVGFHFQVQHYQVSFIYFFHLFIKYFWRLQLCAQCCATCWENQDGNTDCLLCMRPQLNRLWQHDIIESSWRLSGISWKYLEASN